MPLQFRCHTCNATRQCTQIVSQIPNPILTGQVYFYCEDCFSKLVEELKKNV